jgi:hypothetical protein
MLFTSTGIPALRCTQPALCYKERHLAVTVCCEGRSAARRRQGTHHNMRVRLRSIKLTTGREEGRR